jgi:hypothetical protein
MKTDPKPTTPAIYTMPADIDPFTWGNFRTLSSEAVARYNELARRSNGQAEKIEKLEVYILALKTLIECGPKVRDEKNQDTLDRIAAAVETLAEVTADHGDQTSRARLHAAGKLPPCQTADLEKSLGMDDEGETLKL